MRTTLNVNDELLRRAKALAAERGTTLTSVFEDALRTAIDRSERPVPREKIVLPTFQPSRPIELPPGISWDRIAHLLDDDPDIVAL